VSKITGRWIELNTEHENKYTGKGRCQVITMSKTSGVVEGLYEFVAWVSGPKIGQEFSSA
jgi:hypothetical protein